MEDKKNKSKLPMYYQQIYDLMQTLNEAHNKRLGQIYFRIFKQLYTRVSFVLDERRQQYYESAFEEFSEMENMEKSEFRGLTYRYEELKIEQKSNELYNKVYNLQLELYRDLEDSEIFTFMKQNVYDLEVD